MGKARVREVTKEEIDGAWKLWLEVDAGGETIPEEECLIPISGTESIRVDPKLAIAFREIRKRFRNADPIFQRMFALIDLWGNHVAELNVLFRSDRIHQMAIWAAATAPLDDGGQFYQGQFMNEVVKVGAKMVGPGTLGQASESVN